MTDQGQISSASSEGVPVEKLGFFKKLALIIVKPKKLFDAVKSESGFGRPIKYFLIIYIFIALIQGSRQVALAVIRNPASPVVSVIFTAGLLVVLLPVLFGLVLAGFFVIAGIYHLIGKIFRIKNPFSETFKAVIYGVTPYVIVDTFNQFPFYDKLLIAYVNLGMLRINIFSIWAFILIALGLSKLQEIKFSKALLVVIIPAIIYVIFAIIFFADMLKFVTPF